MAPCEALSYARRLMRHITSHLVWPALVCVVLLVACVGDEGTTCFHDDECNGALICCHVGSPFTQGTCETQKICSDMQGGTGGAGGAAGAGGSGGAGGAAGEGGMGGAGGSAGEGGMSGAGGSGGAGGEGGMGGADGGG